MNLATIKSCRWMLLRSMGTSLRTAENCEDMADMEEVLEETYVMEGGRP
jgi:hypothetical protein